MGEAEKDLEHLSKVERAFSAVTGQLWDLASKFGPDSEEEILVRQAETGDWDLARRKTLLSELTVRLQKQKPKS